MDEDQEAWGCRSLCLGLPDVTGGVQTPSVARRWCVLFHNESELSVVVYACDPRLGMLKRSGPECEASLD